jgi:hypothetical protein
MIDSRHLVFNSIILQESRNYGEESINLVTSLMTGVLEILIAKKVAILKFLQLIQMIESPKCCIYTNQIHLKTVAHLASIL